LLRLSCRNESPALSSAGLFLSYLLPTGKWQSGRLKRKLNAT
jgi:hypothetical protein